MADKSITRMNLSAIKKIDPYAKDIVDSSSHVAFYTFNSEQNEWEKTDVEGAFFIYNRNAEPFHSIFINNRLNTTSFVEPITGQLELQSQPPFLLYRNERSRIRGFWFYNSEECDRISNLVNTILLKNGNFTMSTELYSTSTNLRAPNTNIFKMLSKAQQEYNAQKTQQEMTPCNVLQFFASAKQTKSDASLHQCLTLSVDQLEKQQRTTTPNNNLNNTASNGNRMSPTTKQASLEMVDNSKPCSFLVESNPKTFQLLDTSPSLANTTWFTSTDAEQCLRRLLVKDLLSDTKMTEETKPALMPPTMFDNTNTKSAISTCKKSNDQQQEHGLSPQLQPLNSLQFIRAFKYLMENDKEFVEKLHEAYIKSFSKSYFDASATYQ